MGARGLIDIIKNYPYVSNVYAESDSRFSFIYQRIGELPKSYTVYMPTRDDYEVSIEVVERAFRNGANVIVYDTWIKPTISGSSRAEVKSIKVFSFGAFLHRIKKSQSL